MVAKLKKNKKGFRQNIFLSVFLGLSILAIVGLLLVSNFKINQRRAQYNARVEELREQLRVLEIKHQQLEAQISQTSQESYLEKQAREQFNLKKAGEEVVAVLPAEEEEVKQEKGFWEKLLDNLKFW